MSNTKKKKKKKKKYLKLSAWKQASITEGNLYPQEKKKKTKRFVSACQIKLLHPLSLPRV